MCSKFRIWSTHSVKYLNCIAIPEEYEYYAELSVYDATNERRKLNILPAYKIQKNAVVTHIDIIQIIVAVSSVLWNSSLGFI